MTSLLSIDKLAMELGQSPFVSITNKYAAYEIAKMALDKGLIFKEKTASPFFAEYVDAFWDYENSDYIKRRNKEKPNSIGRTYADQERRLFSQYVVPNLPKQLRLQDVQLKHVEKVRDTLFSMDDISNSTINKTLQTMRSPLKDAFRLGLIESDIAERIKNGVATAKEKGIPTIKEMTRLLDALHRQKD